MLHVLFGARRRAVSPLLVQALGTFLLLIGFFAAAPQAHGQAMKAAVGVYRPSVSKFFLDGNFDHNADLKLVFGTPVTDVGLLGDLAGAGTRYPVVFRGGAWYVDSGKDGSIDQSFFFGAPGDVPLIADIDGNGTDDPIVFRNGAWYVSATHDGNVTHSFGFGAPGDTPLIGDVDGTGSPALFVYRNVGGLGVWYGSSKRDGVVDRTYLFGGAPQDIPVLFDFDGDGKADLGIFRDGVWYVSTNRDGNANVAFIYGTTGDKPLYAGAGATSTQFLDAARFLTHASFGPTATELTKAVTLGFSAYIDDQFTKPATTFPAMAWQPVSQPSNCTSPLTPGGPPDAANFGTNCPRDLYTQFVSQRYFFSNALTAPDQLRQRVAWALSQIIVTSASPGNEFQMGYALRNYQQLLQDYAFDNFWNILFRASVDPFMGDYLDMVNNAKADPTKGTNPNENYAREIMQLFSIGLWELNQDGSLVLDATGNPIPTYSQTDITQMAGVMTGWTYWPLPLQNIKWNAPVNFQFNMTPCEGSVPPSGGVVCGTTNWHDTTAKTVMFAGTPYYGPVSMLPNQTADSDLSVAVNALFYHPNTGVFIGKQLIQHLVTSNPSPAYVQRVTQKFNDNGSGVRGDMKAVIKAVLLDPEALAPRNPVTSSFGKLKEPVMLVTNLLRVTTALSDGVYPTLQTPNMDQNVYTSPTVFNYYPADYVIPGSNLAGPQFGIFNATTYFPRANIMYNLTLGASCPAATPNVCGPNPDATVKNSVGTKIDYGQLTPFANNSNNLIQQVNNMLLFGTMPPGMKLAIKTAIDDPGLGGPSGPYIGAATARPGPDRGVPRHRFAQVPTGVLT